MKTATLWMGAAVLVLAAACNRTDTRTSSGLPADGDDRQASVTLTGCLQPGEQGLGSSEPNAASRSSEDVDRFVLANAKMPGAAPSAPNEAAGPLYMLDGKTDELRQHIGQQVEVTGKPENDTATNQGNARRLEVESVRMIASTCAR